MGGFSQRRGGEKNKGTQEKLEGEGKNARSCGVGGGVKRNLFGGPGGSWCNVGGQKKELEEEKCRRGKRGGGGQILQGRGGMGKRGNSKRSEYDKNQTAGNRDRKKKKKHREVNTREGGSESLVGGKKWGQKFPGPCGTNTNTSKKTRFKATR